jgi:hypothetical protein
MLSGAFQKKNANLTTPLLHQNSHMQAGREVELFRASIPTSLANHMASSFALAPSEVARTLVCSLFSAHYSLKSVLLSPITKASHTGQNLRAGDS